MTRLIKLMFNIAVLMLLVFYTTKSNSYSDKIVIGSDPWRLIGNWQPHLTATQKGTVLLLHKAAGNRNAYNRMATVLAKRGYASLRIDLRGHGESTNVRAFDPTISRFENQNDPAVTANFALIKQGYLDIIQTINWLRKHKSIDKSRFIVIGSSYTGEQMVMATESTGFADVYIALAPGNFSKQSVTKIDPSGKPWLFVRAKKEMSFMDGIFETISKGSKADIWVLPGEGHATDLFQHNKDLEEKLVNWIDEN